MFFNLEVSEVNIPKILRREQAKTMKNQDEIARYFKNDKNVE